MQITVVGTGYVGLVTGTCLADMGNNVVCYDVDAEKIAALEQGTVPIYEPGLTELVRRNVRDRRLSFAADAGAAVSNAEIVVLAVGTPPDEDGSADRRQVLDAARTVASHVKAPVVIVVKSTVPVGTCDEVRDVVGDRASDIVSNPEFLKEGKAVEDFMRPDRIVVGASSESAFETMRQLYEPFTRNGHPILEMDLRSAEMTKYAANVMLATRISLMNELARVCDSVGADIMEVRRGIGSDRRIGMSYLYPGVGFGGSCLPKDVRALARMAGESELLGAVERVNVAQKSVLAERVVERFGGDLSARRIALWGLAFKPQTDDVREAPALAMAVRLLDAGATVCAYDPEAMPNAKRLVDVELADDPYAALKGADALVVATEWGVFRSPDFARIKQLLTQPIVFDGRNLFDPARMRELGFEYSSTLR